MTKKLYIKTYGCQMNVYDSGKMADLMKTVGYELTDAPEGADMVVLNTCHIREKAAEKMYSDLGRLRDEKDATKKEQGKDMVIAVAGCVGQAEGKEIFRRAPYVDLVVGPQSYHTLPDLVMQAQRQKGTLALDFTENEKFDALPATKQLDSPSAFLTIQEGCDKFCTFCVVPYTRGAEYSRPVPEVYREALHLVGRGAKELVLLGQNVNAYHGTGLDGDTWSLGALIRHLAKIKGLERIRYMTSHPRDMHDELYAVHAEEPKCMPFLHLPLQAGSDRTLQAMNRKHTREDYLRIIEKMRKARPDIAISSDFIVGFPGETDADFKDTLKAVEQVGYSQCYSFSYSPRPGTPASERETQVPEDVKHARLQELQALLFRQQLAFNQKFVGHTVPVLLEKKGRHPGQWIGKTPHQQSVHLEVPHTMVGQTLNVHITHAGQNSLSGMVVGDQMIGLSDHRMIG